MAAMPHSDDPSGFVPQLIRTYDVGPPEILLNLDSLHGNFNCYGHEKQGQTKLIEKPAQALTVYRHFAYVVDFKGGPIVKLRLFCPECARQPRFAAVLGRVIGA